MSSMFPSFGTWETVFPLTGNRCLFHGRNIFADGNNVSRVSKMENIEERCVRSKCFWQHVSSFWQGLKNRFQHSNINCLTETTLNTASTQNWVQTDPKWLCFTLPSNTFADLQEKRKKTLRGQKVDFDLFYFSLLSCYCRCDDWVWTPALKLNE